MKKKRKKGITDGIGRGKKLPSKAPETAWEIYYNYHPVIFIFFNFLYLQMKYGADRFNRNPRGSAPYSWIAPPPRPAQPPCWASALIIAPSGFAPPIPFIFICCPLNGTIIYTRPRHRTRVCPFPLFPAESLRRRRPPDI